MVIRRTGVSVLLSVLLIGGMLGTASAQQTLQLPSIVTVGLGHIIVEADHIVVALGIETQDESAEQANEQSRTIVQAISRELVENELAGLEIIPGRVNLWQQRTSSRPMVYRATSTLTVMLADEADVGLVIDIAMRHGAASVQNVKFQAVDLDAASKEALTLAVNDAMAKAEVISKATGMRVVTIRRVTDANKVEVFNPSDPILVEFSDAPRMPSQFTVERGEILVQVEVTMEFDVATQ